MTKARVAYAFHAGIFDNDRNEAIADYMTRGQCICSTIGTGPAASASHTLTIWPFNADKSIWDTLRIIGRVRWFAAFDHELQFTPDTGATWLTVIPAGVLPYAIDPPEGGLVQHVNTDDWNLDLDLTTGATAVVGFQWIGLRFQRIVVGNNYDWTMNAYLTNSVRTPY